MIIIRIIFVVIHCKQVTILVVMDRASDEMENTKKLKITNRKQFEWLALMERYPEIAKGLKFVSSKEQYSSVWKEATSRLNSLGPTIRPTKEWQKVWADLKLKTKKKLLLNKTESVATGGGPNRMVTFTSIEESVITLLSLDKAVQHTGNVFGLANTLSEPAADLPVELENIENELVSECQPAFAEAKEIVSEIFEDN